MLRVRRATIELLSQPSQQNTLQAEATRVFLNCFRASGSFQ
jgi:hypothetical protein